MANKNFKPTLSKPSSGSANMKQKFKKEMNKQSGIQGLKSKPKIKFKEEKDDFAMNQSGYNDLGIGKLKTNRKKDLDSSFKELTFESLNYIDESDNKNIRLDPVKREIKENKNMISKKELIENTLKKFNNSGELDDLYLEETKLENELRSYRNELKDEKDAKKRENLRDSVTEVMNEIVEIRQKISNLSPNLKSKYKIKETKIIDETTTSASSGQYQTPFAWAPNKKGWANANKKWWGPNSPNTGGTISKGGIVNIKDKCKGYSSS